MSLSKRLSTVSKLYPYLWPNDWKIKLRLIVAISLLLGTMILNVSVPLILRQVIDAISAPSSAKLIAVMLLVAYGLAWTLSKSMEHLRFLAVNRVIARGMRLLCLNAFNHLINLSLRFHSSRKTGEIISAIERAQYAFWPFFCGLFLIIMPTLIEMIAAATILTYLYGAQYGVILALILSSHITFSIFASQWSARTQSLSNEKSSQVSTMIVDSLLNYETIRYFDAKQFEYNRCNALLAEREDAATKQHFSAEVVQLGQAVIMGIGLIILTYLSGSQVINGTLKISDFVLINVYLLQFMTPLGYFGYVLRDMNEGLTNIQGVVDILDEQPDIHDRNNAAPLAIKQRIVTFDSVQFGYDPRRAILQNVSFEIPSKKTTAIVGSTGAGKSTIAKLLFRYYDVSGGHILIDGQDIQNVTQASLQSSIGVVPQHAALFNDTLYYNIAYGRPDATEVD